MEDHKPPTIPATIGVQTLPSDPFRYYLFNWHNLTAEEKVAAIRLYPYIDEADFRLEKKLEIAAKTKPKEVAIYDKQGRRRPPKVEVTYDWERKDSFVGNRFLHAGCAMFQLPLNGTTYGKREALNHISKTLKHSNERSAMIRFMVEKGYVPCTAKCLYELVRRTEVEGLPVGDDGWGSRGHPTREASSRKNRDSVVVPRRQEVYYGKGSQHYAEMCEKMGCEGDWKTFAYFLQNSDAGMHHHDKDIFHKQKRHPKAVKVHKWDLHARKSLWGERAWKGSIYFDEVIPVKLNDDLDELFGKKLYIGRLAKGKERPCRIKRIDICSYIGNFSSFATESGESTTIRGEEIHRIYFHPNRYPPPKNMNEGGSNSTFDRLRTFIRDASKHSGSPVICNGGNKNERQFVCIYNRERRSQGDAVHCPFRFCIRWDEYGYYIYLRKSTGWKFQLNGCPFHLCRGLKATASRR